MERFKGIFARRPRKEQRGQNDEWGPSITDRYGIAPRACSTTTQILRGLSTRAAHGKRSPQRSSDAVLERGAIVPTRRLDPSPVPLTSAGGPWTAVLEHEKLPFVSYPYEWSFEMLKDAAVLQLDLVLAALDEGIGLKDASAYNVQWKGAAPVFVDVASFYKRAEREPWVGYRQFCQMFLYPLLIQAYRDVPFQP